MRVFAGPGGDDADPLSDAGFVEDVSATDVTGKRLVRSAYTVARELGHEGGGARIEGTCGHPRKRRARLSGVRYAEADVLETG